MLFSVIRIHKSKVPLTNLHMFTNINRSQDSAVITLQAENARNRGSILDRGSVHTGSSTHSEYYLTGMGWGNFLPRGYSVRRVKLTTHLHLVMRLRSGVPIPPPSSPYAIMAFTGTPLHSRTDLSRYTCSRTTHALNCHELLSYMSV
jgi:hypothetical protein